MIKGIKKSKFLYLLIALSLVAIVYALESHTEEFIPLTTTNSITNFYTGAGGITLKEYNQTWLDFDGVNDYVRINNSQTLNISNYDDGLTACFWVYLNDFGGFQTLLSKGRSAASAPYATTEWVFGSDSGGTTKFDVVNTTGGFSSVNFNKQQNSWFHICSSVNTTGTEGNVTIYKNGTQNAQTTIKGKIQNANQNVCLGCDLSRLGDDRFILNGSLDDVRIYNYSLRSNQISNIYKITSGNGRNKKYIPELTFHNIENNNGSDDYYFNVSKFSALLDYLNSNGYETVTYKNVRSWIDGSYTMPSKPIILSFDDNNLDVYTNATPLMDNYGYIGSMNVVISQVGQTGKMSWEQIQALHNKGWEVASHSLNHVDMKTQSVSQRAIEFSKTKSLIEGNLTGVNVTTWVYPYNSLNLTLQLQCHQYYTLCTGLSRVYDTDFQYIYQDSNSTLSQIYRISVRVNNTVDMVKEMLNVDYRLNLHSKLNENNGSIAYDSSGNGNDGTITGATWDNDGVLNTLVSGVDYTVNLALSTITVASNKLYTYLVLSWSYTNPTYASSCNIVSDDAREFFTGLVWILSLLSVGVILVVMRFMLINTSEIVNITGEEKSVQGN